MPAAARRTAGRREPPPGRPDPAARAGLGRRLPRPERRGVEGGAPRRRTAAAGEGRLLRRPDADRAGRDRDAQRTSRPGLRAPAQAADHTGRRLPVGRAHQARPPVRPAARRRTLSEVDRRRRGGATAAGTAFMSAPQPSFFAELKRRNVYKVGAMYGVAGWLLVQVATQVFPFFDIPNWVVRVVVIAIVAGFPLALVLSWIYELT